MEMEDSNEQAPLANDLNAEDSQTPNYDSIFGDAKKDHKYSNQTVIGQVRNPKKFSWIEWTFLVLSIIAFAGTLGITFERLVHFKREFTYNDTRDSEDQEEGPASCDQWTCSSDFIYTILLIANILYCLFYAIDGVLRERGFEILAIPVAIAIVLIYIIGNYIYKSNEFTNGVRIARLVLAVVFGPPLAVLAVMIYIRNGRLQFNVVGSNQMLMRIYRIRSFMNTLLLFNLHLMSNLVILAMVRDKTLIDVTEQVFIVIFIVYMVMIVAVGWIGVNYELIWLTGSFGIFYIPSVAFYVYKIINVGMNYNDYKEGEEYYYGSLETYRFVAGTMFVVCGLGILLYVVTLVFTVLTARDYRKGLNDKMSPPFKELVMKILSKTHKEKSSNYVVTSST